MTDFMKDTQSEIQQIQGQIEALVHLLHTNQYVYTDLERIRNPETEFAVSQTVDDMDRIRMGAKDVQASVAKSAKKIDELGMRSRSDFNRCRSSAHEIYKSLRLELSNKSDGGIPDEEVREYALDMAQALVSLIDKITET